MHERAEGEAPHYRAARLRTAIAEDPRTNELGVGVTVRGNDVYLSGTVASAQRKEELDLVLHENAPGMSVHNEVRIVEVGEPGEPEELR
ncbi:MAG: BON domain-containing protein [Haloechinothrix sp.]